MERNKRAGTVTIVASILLAFAAIVFSENPCAGSSASWLNLLLICLRVNVYEEIPGNEYGEHMFLPTRFLLLACTTLFAIGVLWYKGALSVPGSHIRESQEQKKGSQVPTDP